LLAIPEPETIPKDPRTVFNSPRGFFPANRPVRPTYVVLKQVFKRQGTPSLRWGKMSHNVVAELLLSD
jgi:hypothetical protein